MRALTMIAVLGPMVGLLGCQPEGPGPAGIAVGNPPGKVDDAARVVVTVADGLDVFMTDFEMPLRGIYLENCEGNARVYEVEEGAVVRLDTPIEMPVGRWCGVGLAPRERTVRLRGESDTEASFRFQGGLGRILLFNRQGFDLDGGDTLVMELAEPGWLSAATLGLRPRQQLEIGGPDCLEDPRCVRIRAGLMDQAGLYRDRDDDGRVGDQERDEGTDAAGDARDTRG